MADLSDFRFAITFQTPKLDLKGKTDKQKAAANKALIRGMQNGMNRIETSLSQALDSAMQSSSWGWPRQTLRKNGSTAGTSRDIIDTGALMRSKKLKVDFKQTKASLNIRYTAPYAAIVHYGGYIIPYGRPGRAAVNIPGRPWITATFEGTNGVPKFDADTILNNAIKEAWTQQFG
ncbi:MAG: hypothetical protein ACO3HF_01000 [Burkholderiaceae bacterium]